MLASAPDAEALSGAASRVRLPNAGIAILADGVAKPGHGRGRTTHCHGPSPRAQPAASIGKAVGKSRHDDYALVGSRNVPM
jgi:hypothetical protein